MLIMMSLIGKILGLVSIVVLQSNQALQKTLNWWSLMLYHHLNLRQ